MNTLTLPPGVTVGPLDPDTGRRPVYRYGEEIGAVFFAAYLGPETAETCYTIEVGGVPYREIFRPLTLAVLAVDASAS